MSRRTEIDKTGLEAAKQHVRRQLAIHAGHPDEADIPSNERPPLGRHFDLSPFDTEMIEKLGVMGIWSPEALFRKFTQVDESSIEPFYGDNAESPLPYSSVEMHEENSLARATLQKEAEEFQLSAINLITECAKHDLSFYRLVVTLNQKLANTDWEGPSEVRRAIADTLARPKPTGRGGAKKSKNFKRDLLLLSLIQDLLSNVKGLAATGAQNTQRGDEACSIVTTVWNEEFRAYSYIEAGTVKQSYPAKPLPATAARNIWVKRSSSRT
jgi:hypothetical protein